MYYYYWQWPEWTSEIKGFFQKEISDNVFGSLKYFHCIEISCHHKVSLYLKESLFLIFLIKLDLGM